MFDVLTPPEWVPLSRYIGFLPAVLVLWSAMFLLSGLYQTRRRGSRRADEACGGGRRG